MRATYELTDQTRKVLTNNVISTAEEMCISDKYLYGILSGDKTDPFAVFERLYAASVRAGSPVCHWDVRLASIRARYEKTPPAISDIDCLTQKIEINAETAKQMVAALKDGQIDRIEATRILAAVKKERDVLDVIETVMQFKSVLPDEIRQKAQARRAA